MSETKFTPGPWIVMERAVVAVRRFVIAEVFSDPLKKDSLAIEESKANLNLIAAAPDLFEALENLEPYLDAIVCYASTITEHPPNGFILKARAALAKARGEE